MLPALCAGCGICAGSCPSSTPFRRAPILASGIELPDLPMDDLRRALDAAVGHGERTVIVFACSPGRSAAARDDARAARIDVECAAMVPPAFVEYALRAGAAGVVIAGCRQGDCEYRLGDAWTDARVAGLRAPVLRSVVPRDRVRLAWCGNDARAVRRAIDELAAAPLPSPRRPARQATPQELPHA